MNFMMIAIKMFVHEIMIFVAIFVRNLLPKLAELLSDQECNLYDFLHVFPKRRLLVEI